MQKSMWDVNRFHRCSKISFQLPVHSEETKLDITLFWMLGTSETLAWCQICPPQQMGIENNGWCIRYSHVLKMQNASLPWLWHHNDNALTLECKSTLVNVYKSEVLTTVIISNKASYNVYCKDITGIMEKKERQQRHTHTHTSNFTASQKSCRLIHKVSQKCIS